ncbi:MAG: DDE-type integrase/transposase/recombinase [Candidatus Jordarchaeaceae archaeon]
MKNSREFNQRELRGLAIVAKGDMIRQVAEDEFLVRSSSLEKQYKVVWDGQKWVCECSDHQRRQKPCKHIYAILFFRRLPFILMANAQNVSIKCPKCNSNNIVRKGFVRSKEFAAQRYLCKACGHKFTDKGENKGLKGNPLAMVAIADLYFKGLSLRMIEDHMKKVYSIDVSYPTLHRQIKRFISRMKILEKQRRLNAGERWHIDETIVKVGGKTHYLWNVLDSETRLLLASSLTDGRGSKEAEAVIRQALSRAAKPPKEIVTDGLRAYEIAMKKDYGIRIKHISKIRFNDPANNNLVERLNGTLKNRIRGFRRLDNKESSAQLLDGLRIYYNTSRSHMALKGKPPIEVSMRSKHKMI